MTTTDATPSTPDYEGLLIEEHEQVLSVRLDNPSRANALTPAMLEGLETLFCRPPPEVRAILLGGAGEKHFSSGLDLGGRTPEDLATYLPETERQLRAAADTISSCPVPVIAVLNGAAFGGALELAIACDWRLAAAGARLGMPAARLGVIYAPEGLTRFVAALGPGRTKELFLTATPIDASRALEIGLVERVVDDATLWSAAQAAAAEVVLAAPLAVEGTRRIIDALAHGGLDGLLNADAQRARQRAFGSVDFIEALAAFRQKRPPDFKGY